MLVDLINIKRLRLIAMYAAYLSLAFFFQDSVFNNLRIFGVKPLFIPAAVVAIGMFEQGIWGGALGLFIGLVADRCMGYSALFTILFPVIGFFSGILSRWLINKRFVAFIAAGFAAILVTGMFQILTVWAFYGQMKATMFINALIQAAISIPFTAPLYVPCKWINAKFGYVKFGKGLQ